MWSIPPAGISSADARHELSAEQLRVLRAVARLQGATVEELAVELDMTPEKVVEVQKYGREPISLHTPLGEDGDSEFGDLIEDSEAIVPADAVSFTLLQEQLHAVLDTLSEREAGSDAAGMKTRARKDGNNWVLNGSKCWITNGGKSTWYTVMAVTDPEKKANGISAFMVHKDDPGFTVGPLEKKLGIKGSPTAELYFEDCTIPLDRIIGDEGTGFKTALQTLDHTRPTIGAQAVGIAQGALDKAIEYVKDRKQFGKPLGAHQMVQERLAQMLDEVTAMQTRCVAVARLQAAGRLRDEQASLLKYACTRGARRVAQIARDMLGGNGILLEHRVMRHFADVEALHTYEGTESVQALILGRDLTGMSAFA